LANQIPILTTNTDVIKKRLRKVCNGLLKKNFKYLSKFEIKDNIITFFNNEKILFEYEDKIRNITEKPVDEISDIAQSMFEIMRNEISSDENNFPFYILVARSVPEDMIFRFISIARHEGQNKMKLFTHLVMTEAKDYIQKYIPNPQEPPIP
jgi:hypothetical protein